MENHKGKLAMCSRGALGLITSGRKKKVKFPDGQMSVVYVGIHLTDKIAPIGSPWCSRNPDIYGYVSDILDRAEMYKQRFE